VLVVPVAGVLSGLDPPAVLSMALVLPVLLVGKIAIIGLICFSSLPSKTEVKVHATLYVVYA